MTSYFNFSFPLLPLSETFSRWNEPAILTENGQFEINEPLLKNRELVMACATVALALVAVAYIGASSPLSVGILWLTPFAHNDLCKNHRRTLSLKLHNLILKTFNEDKVSLNPEQLKYISKDPALIALTKTTDDQAFLTKLLDAAIEADSFDAFKAVVDKVETVTKGLILHLLGSRTNWAIYALNNSKAVSTDTGYSDHKFNLALWKKTQEPKLAQALINKGIDIKERFDGKTLLGKLIGDNEYLDLNVVICLLSAGAEVPTDQELQAIHSDVIRSTLMAIIFTFKHRKPAPSLRDQLTNSAPFTLQNTSSRFLAFWEPAITIGTNPSFKAFHVDYRTLVARSALVMLPAALYVASAPITYPLLALSLGVSISYYLAGKSAATNLLNEMAAIEFETRIPSGEVAAYVAEEKSAIAHLIKRGVNLNTFVQGAHVCTFLQFASVGRNGDKVFEKLADDTLKQATKEQLQYYQKRLDYLGSNTPHSKYFYEKCVELLANKI